MNRNFLYGTAILIGTIIGAGIFGIPYGVAQSGFLIGAIFLLVLTVISTLMHLIFGEIVCRTKGKHRLVGYADRYLGKWGKRIITFSLLISFYGALLVYIILGGKFLSTIFSSSLGGSSFVYSLIFFIIGTLAVFKGLALTKKLELFMSLFLIIVIFLIFFSGFSHLDIDNLKFINLKNFFLPYGIILWALAGSVAIPEMMEALKMDGKRFKKAIIIGTLIPAGLYFLFMFTVVGITGLTTSPEAIDGLVPYLGKAIIILGAVFGALAGMTSFFILGISLKKLFWYDYKMNKNLSWFLVCSVPLIGFLLGLREFIPIIGFLGVVLGAVEGTAIVLIYKKAKKLGDRKPEYNLRISNFIIYSLIGIFVLGFIYQIVYFLK